MVNYCSCWWSLDEFTEIPAEGLLSFPVPQDCWEREISITLKNGDGEVVPGTVDETSEDAQSFGQVIWRAEAPPLAEGVTYQLEHLVSHPYEEYYDEASCDVEWSFKRGRGIVSRDDSAHRHDLRSRGGLGA